MKKLIFLLVALVCGFVSLAQKQPFEQYGYKVKIATLSKGKYIEHFDQDTIVQIGTVLMNRRNGKIVSFVKYDTTLGEYSLKPELISRWMSPDPLAHEFYSESPYNFGHNNPVRFIDPDGRAPFDVNGGPPGWWQKISDYFGFGSWFGQGSDNPEVLADQAQHRASMREVGNRIENLYEGQKSVMTVIPGMSSVYNMFEANRGLQTNGEAAMNMSVNAAIDLVGGSLVKLGGKTLAIQVHHLIPESLIKNNPVLQQAIEGGFKMQGDANKIPLARFVKDTGEGVHAKHPAYTTAIGNAMNSFMEGLNKAGEKLTPNNARQFVERLMKDTRSDIINNPTTKINDLYKTGN